MAETARPPLAQHAPQRTDDLYALLLDSGVQLAQATDDREDAPLEVVPMADPASTGPEAPGEASPAAAGKPEADAVRRALRDAMQHAATVHGIARRIPIEPGDLLRLIGSELDRVPPRREAARVLTAAELDALAAANIDLSGPQAPTAGLRTVLASARQFGSGLTVGQAALLIGVSAGRVRQRLAEGSLHGVRPTPRSPWRMPAWQFDGGTALPGLETVLRAVPPGLHPLALEHVMTTADPDLLVGDEPVSPASWLTTGGDPAQVAELLRHVPGAA